MNRHLIAVLAIAVAPSIASASSISVATTDFTANGVNERAEFRGGAPGSANAGGWEVGVGPNTQASGLFGQAQIEWGSNPLAFTYVLGGDGTASVTIGGETASWTGTPGMGAGNAIKIAAKRDASVTISDIDGVAVNQTLNGDVNNPFGVDLVLTSSHFLDGFTLTGLIDVGVANSFATNGVTIEAGDVAAVPLPAPFALLGLGLGALGLLGARRKA